MPRNPRADQIGTGGRIKSESPGGCARNAQHSLSGLAEALRGADFSSLQQVNEPTKEREVERTYERDMGEDFGL